MNLIDWQPVINGAGMLILFLLGVLVRSIWSAITQLQADLKRLQEQIAGNQENTSNTYVRRDDFQTLASRIEATLIRIESKLDGKADK